MRNKTLYSLFALVLLAGMVFSLVQPASAMVKPAAQGLDKVEPAVLNTISAKGASDYVVEMAEKADLSAAYEIEDWTERGWFVYNTLKETAARTQQPVIELLKAGGVSYQSFFAGNEIAVTGGDLNSLSAIAALPGVSHIRYPRTATIEPMTFKAADVAVPEPEAFDWGITDTHAPDFWSTFGFQGDGIVVANVDTGVQWDHPALDQSFKCGTNPSDPSCWADPSNICGGSACDNNGHGTHTMGTMVGDDDPSLTYQVGMAPNAQWIACKGCETNSCSDTALNACADWIVAPDGDPANRPNVVNNSWGGGSGDDWYLAKVNAWRAAGIFPAFSAGNNYSCKSLGSPGDYQESFATASHTSSRTISDFSSKGPSAFGDDPYTKPNISAPGSNICSTVPGSGWNCGYSGTSMASPHTAGAVALLWSCNPSLIGDMATTFELLQDTADTPPPGSCGAPADGEGNYTFGYGYLNVLTAGNQVCSSGSLAGFVYDATSMAPVEGATVTADNGGGIVVDTTTLADGSYLMNLPEGTYDVSATKYGYTTDLVTGIVIVEGDLVTQDFYIDLLGMTTVSGYVTDGGVEGLGLHGYPLYSSIHITATGFDETLYVDPFTGYYEIELVEETDHTFVTTAVPSGYDVLTETVTPTGATYAHDIELMADGEACAAPGYQPDYDIFYSFEGSDEGFTPGGTTSFAWGDFTSGPGEGHSGTKGIATNPAGNYNANELGWMASPVIDLTGFGTSTPVIQWYDWKDIESVSWDWARVDVTKDGGTTWTTVWGPVGGVSDTAYEQQTVVLDPTYNVANFQFRFYFKSDSSVQYEGWYIDDIGIISVSAPPPTTVWSSNFDADNGGFVSSGANSSWAWGAPTSGPNAAYSDPNVWATNLSGYYNNSEESYITSPVIDLSGYAGLAPTISFWHWYSSESNTWDWAGVEVSNNGGTTWTSVWEKFGTSVSPWTFKSLQLDPTYAVSNFQFRFHFHSDSSVNSYYGWYIDDVAVSVAEPVVIAAPCVVVRGGVVAGYVYDDNTLDPLTGAGVISDTGAAGTTFAIPEETEGFYWIFQPATVTALAAAPVPAAISGGGSTSALTTSGGSVAVAPVTAPPAVNAILWDQPLSAVSTAAYVNQEFSDYPDYSSFLADDFVAADPWTITSLFIPGDGWNGFSSLLNATALNFQIYADNAGIPAGYPGGGAPVWSLSVPPTDLQVTLTTGSGGYLSNATLTPAAPINLPPGHYWLVYYPTMSFGSYGQFGRQPADTTNGYVGQFINPGGGFGYGNAWQPWTVIGPTQQDIAFRIEGMAITSEFHDFTASMDKYMDDTETVEVMMNAITQQDFYLGAGWLEFDPEFLEVTMMMGDAPLTETLTISNLGDADAIIEISEKDEGYLPPLHIPAFTGTLPEDTRPVSMGPAPDAKPMPLSAAGALRNLLAGEPATAIDIYPGENLVHIPDTTVPGYWDIVGSVGGTQFFAGDFTGGDFSTLYVADYGNNNLYAVDTATAVYTLIGPTTPPAGQTFSGLTGTPDGMLYGLTTSCSSSNLVTVDPETGATTNLGALGPIACGIDLAYNTDNDLIYIVDLITDHLFSVDPATLAVVDIGSLGASANYAQGMDYEEETGILYWAAYTTQGELRVIDMTTGASALVGAFPSGAETDCLAFETGGGADVPWLSEDPVSGTVPAMSDLVVDVTFDPTGAGLGQPGDYLAELKVKHDTPYAYANIPVTLHLLAPADYGTFNGTVTGLEACDVNPMPLEGATVNFWQGGSILYTTTTLANGYYGYSLPEGTYDIEVLMDGYVSMIAFDMPVAGGETVTVDFELRLDAPCLSVDPTSLEQWLMPDTTGDQTLTLVNSGAGEAVFEIVEMAVAGILWDVEMVVDDGTAEDSIGLSAGGQFIWLNRFTPDPDAFPFTVDEVQVIFNTTVGATDQFQVVIYSDTDGDGDPGTGAVYLGGETFTVQYNDMLTFNVFTLTEPVQVEGPGDVLIGLVNRSGASGYSDYPAAIDQSASQQRSWIGTYAAGNPPAEPPLPADSLWGRIDDFGFAGNWTLRAYGSSAAGDIVWLSEDPVSGTVAGDSELDVTVTFDATGLALGDYFANLRVKNPPAPAINVPVTLHVVETITRQIWLPIIMR